MTFMRDGYEDMKSGVNLEEEVIFVQLLSTTDLTDVL